MRNLPVLISGVLLGLFGVLGAGLVGPNTSMVFLFPHSSTTRKHKPSLTITTTCFISISTIRTFTQFTTDIHVCDA